MQGVAAEWKTGFPIRRADGPVIVSTGRWGCGAFGGLAAHKFALQVLAARLAGVHLRFSTMGSPDGCDAVRDAMLRSDASVADAWSLLLRCDRRETFERAFCSGLLSTKASLASATIRGVHPLAGGV